MTTRRLAAPTVVGLVAGMLSMTAGVTVPAVAGTASRAAFAQSAFNAEAVQNAQGARASQDVQVVTLITGDRVAISTTPDRKPQVNVMPAVKGTSFQVMTLGTQVYVIPQTAAGYLGTPLDPSLFDVTRLAAGGYANTAKPLKLSITYARGASVRALPGTTNAGGATVSRAGALRFGAALAAESGSTAHGKLFAGIARIAVAGLAAPAKITGRSAAAPGTAAPGSSTPGRMYTLTVRGLDRLGRPVNGTLADVMSVDNDNNFLADQSFYRGVLKYSLPAGTYEVASYIPTTHSDGSTDFTLATDPQVTVAGDTTVVLDASTATKIAVSTPRPSSVVLGEMALQRNPVAGETFTTIFESFGSSPFYATPTKPVTTGQMYFYDDFRLGDASGSTTSYLYDVQFPYIGSIPGNLATTLTPDQLVTIDARYHSPYPGRPELDIRAGRMPWQAAMSFGSSTVTAPLERTEYVLPHPGMLWYHFLITNPQHFSGFTQDTVHAYQAGEHITDDWLAQPMPPGLEQQTQAGETCPACRSGDSFSVALMPYVDISGHFQLPDPSGTTNLSFYQNGTLAGQSPASSGQFPMSPGPASYKLVLDQSRNAPWWPTTTAMSTSWTWTSQERAPDQLPPGWTCPAPGGGKGTAATGGCSFEPLLFIGYQTNAGADDVVPAGTTATVDITVAHQEGAPATPISNVTAQVSFSDGTTWTPVQATELGGGHYRLSYAQPALAGTSGFASLRITATDAAGSSVNQSIIRAYPLAVLTPPASSATTPAKGQQQACAGSVAAPYAQCMAIVNTAAPATTADGTPAGYGPADLKSAYALPDTGAGQTVAIIDAYDNPSAEADLAKYRAAYGLPPCTTANGCFTKVNQEGKASPLPSPDQGWGLEISLDLDMVSATCPKCHILLVEANSSSIADLGPSVDTAVALGASVVSNSYGSQGEFSGEQDFEQYYRHPGVPIVVSSGDYGYGNGALFINSVSFPASSQYVTAVGGTSLTRDSAAPRGWAESAWSLATSGCSAYIHKPVWQRDDLCAERTVADVSAVADPKTGVAVYDSYGWGGWLVVGGTSAAAPIIASVYALAGNASAQDYASGLYQNPGHLFDVTTGTNGYNCSGTYLCTAVPGYDGPTGLGTPDGTGSF